MPNADLVTQRATGRLPVDEPAQKLLKPCVHFARKASVDQHVALLSRRQDESPVWQELS